MVQTSGTLRDVIFTTLLELYLAEIGTCQTPKDRAAREKRALELMQRKNATFDLDHALGNHSITKFYRFEKLCLTPYAVLAQIHDFKAGILFLYEKAGLYAGQIPYLMISYLHSPIPPFPGSSRFCCITWSTTTTRASWQPARDMGRRNINDIT